MRVLESGLDLATGVEAGEPWRLGNVEPGSVKAPGA
jgi:hypothetical protein